MRAIHAPEAWRYSTGKGITVAIFDSPVDASHEELRNKIRVPATGKFSCGSSTVRCDSSSHGTAVAGVIAALRGNGRGISGIAPDAKILSLHSYSQDVVGAIRYAVAAGARVVNFSWASYVPLPVPNFSEELRRAVEFAFNHGVLVVAAAGNDNVPWCVPPSSEALIVCVGAVDRRDVKAAYSNFGVGLDLVGPSGSNPVSGVCAINLDENIVTPNTSKSVGECGLPRGYTEWSGTSFSAPMVSGVAALLMAKGFSVKQTLDRLTKYADDLGAPGYDPIYGWGRVNALRALTGR